MARPGMKAPPTHSVVVRSGDVPLSDDIPLGRLSVPPSARSSVSVDVSRRERDTQKAVPKPGYRPPPPSNEPAAGRHADSFTAGPGIESSPPPSDGTMVASVPAPTATQRRRSRLPSWTIAAAAAAGLVLGLGSVATTLRLEHSNAASPGGPVAAQPLVRAVGPSAPVRAPSAQQLSPSKPEGAIASSAASGAARSAEVNRRAGAASAQEAIVPPVRRTIF